MNSNAQISFDSAYNSTQFVPKGLLEAVAWTNTHMVHINGSGNSCSGIPQPIGIMGLHQDGQNYFKENARLVAKLSGITVGAQIASPENQILAFALAFDSLIKKNAFDPYSPNSIREVLHQLSEIPDSGYVNYLAKEMQVYTILRFMGDQGMANMYGFDPFHVNLATLFGASNYAVLSADKILFTEQGIVSDASDLFTIEASKSLQYGPAIWNPAPACNFSSRNGVDVSAITIHTIQGSYAGAISWSQNCASSVSFHYVIRSVDGQVTQMVLEEDKGWHVGSENPYTIGYEHEGFVNDPSWYTEAMYQSSAALSRDIIASGYGIPALRTYYGPSSAVTDLIGGCTKIKGHQHYPNQTHTDPGINWNWEKYYQLINNSYTPTVITAASGSVYDTGGSGGDYQDDEREFWLIEPTNANTVTIDFVSFNTELNYDYLFVYDGDSINDPLLGVYSGTNLPASITSTGSSLLIEFRSDCSTISSGWQIDFTSDLADNFPPSTAIVSNATWKTNDFQVDFTDQDIESGIMDRFYLLADKSIATNDWSSKGTFGFAHETFDDNATLWNTISGNFGLNGGTWEQVDVANQNSNSYHNVTQTNAYHYVYEWEQTITSSEASQRAGLHFFCDDATLPNRGNSYFVFLRENDDKVQIYSVISDVFTLEQDIPFAILSGQTYNCKVYYNPSSGLIQSYVDNVLIAEWTDPNPLQSGAAISIRTAGCSALFDNIKVYQSRNNSIIVSAGFGDQLSIESEVAIETGMIESIVIDNANNWSQSVAEYYLLDFSNPTIDFMNDGTGADIDTFYSAVFDGNWNCLDIHSGIVSYSFAVGTLPNLDDVVAWTANGTNTTLSEFISSPIYNQVYHLSIQAENGAGLTETFVSDGQRYMEGLGIDQIDFDAVVVYPNPATNQIQLTGIDNIRYLIVSNDGKVIASGDDQQIDVSQLANGEYTMCIMKSKQMIVKKFVISR